MPALATSGVPIVYAPLFVCLFLWLAAAVGRKLLRWLGVERIDSSAEGAVVAVALGVGALQFVPFALGAAHVLSSFSLRLALLATALLSAGELWRIARRARAAAFASARALADWSVAALAPAVVCSGWLALTPATDADGVSYHLTVPKRWLESGGLGYLPTYPYSNTPMGGEMLFMIALACAGDIAAKMVHFSLGILGVWGIYLAGVRLKSRSVGALAAVLYLVGPAGVNSLLGTAYVEGIIAFAMIGSTLAWLIWLRERTVGWLRAAFVLAGVTITFKLTALVFALGLSALTVSALWDASDGKDESVLRRLGAHWSLALLLALPVVPWLLRSAILTGNPVFPLFVGLIPSRDLSPALAAKFEHYNRYLIWATRFGMGWSIATRKLILLAVAGAVTLAAALAFVRQRQPFGRGAVVVLWMGVLLQISAVGLYTRYWIPILSVLMLPLVASCDKYLSRPWLRPVFIGALALASVLQIRSSFGSATELKETTNTVLGLESANTYLERHLPLYPIYQFANRTLPTSSHVLLGYYCGGFHLDRDTYCAEFVQDSLRFTTWNEFVSDARRLGVTHVIAPTVLTTSGPQPQTTDSAGPSRIIRVKENEFFGRLLKEHATLLVSASDQGLYAVDVPPPDPT